MVKYTSMGKCYIIFTAVVYVRRKISYRFVYRQASVLT
jgi:hypothetical protein